MQMSWGAWNRSGQSLQTRAVLHTERYVYSLHSHAVAYSVLKDLQYVCNGMPATESSNSVNIEMILMRFLFGH